MNTSYLERVIALDETSTSQPPQGSSATSEFSPEELRKIAVRVALEAAELVSRARREASGDDGHVGVQDLKSSAVDPVTEVDNASEKLIREQLLAATPGSRVLGEEDGLGQAQTQDDSGLLWVVDPIDGTVNFIYGLPAYSVSIAATSAGVPIASAVADVAGQVVYSAASGRPAVEQSFADATSGREGRVLRVSGDGDSVDAAGESAASLEQTLVATGFSYLAERRRAQAELLVKLLPQVRDIRRIGSAALDLCHVAAGRVDAYYEHGLGPWDHAAGVLIAARAGAVVKMPKLDVYSDAGLQVSAVKPGVAQAFEQALERGAAGGVLAPVTAP
ncbi:inositol monophosphatase family protein [Corynebacterium suicordis]|uniref:Inositol-1-monophosphatase n=1 Tax=Corynebacterium suicordis DSM 45110 TaxID=1121369 RepID=A0ABR9ZKK0_9CORY|nr:inositol monophosphatase family protein [Corynebacterium suicordis]MBF4553493.1 inositol monophosphatase [Corynebacterium suicordis DSM 45110]MDR6277533.1 myo-inositol-1(or 4)-monophosphatase [Corynebacterium suicordis]